MEEINNNHNFFREAFHDFERQPSDRVWINIEKGIKPSLIHKPPFFKSAKFIVGTSLVAVLSIVLFIVLQPATDVKIKQEEPKTNAQKQENANKIVVKDKDNNIPAEKIIVSDNQKQNSPDNNIVKEQATNKQNILNRIVPESISEISSNTAENKQVIKKEDKIQNTTSVSNNQIYNNQTNNTTQPNLPVNTVIAKKNNVAEISFSPDQSICKGDKVKLYVKGGVSYLWSTGERNREIYVDPYNSTDYSVIVTDENGLQKTGLISVTVTNCETVYVPNAFTPNGDGSQDVFKAVGNGVRNFEMIIVSRSGQVVFTSRNIEDGWDGNYKGNPVQMGTYVYSIKYIDESNKPHTITGHVSVIR